MNKINCIIIEDEPAASTILENFCAKIPTLNHLKTFKNGFLALDFIKENHVDLIYLDVSMPDMNGIEFMKHLNGRCKVILTTAFSEYALDGHEFAALDYLLKPISMEKFTKATYRFNHESAVELQVPELDNYFMVQTGVRNHQQKVFYNDIIYINSALNYANIVTKTEEVKAYLSLRELTEILNENFVRIHKSYIVSLNHVKSFNSTHLSLFDYNEKLPFGETHKERFMNIMEAKNIKNQNRN
jgi:two-component system, LytTR family, response regulator